MNIAKKNTISTSGFTLIELLVVMGALVIIGTISINILVSILRGSLKAQLTKDIKQSGDYALSVMTKMIRNARTIEDCTTTTSIRIKNPDDGETVFSCDTVNPLASKISSASAHLNPTPVPEPVTSTAYKLENCSIICTNNPGKPSIVEIKFTLSKDTATFRAEEKLSVNFATKVALRTY